MGKSRQKDQLIEWGVATLALPGQTVSGDLYVVKSFPNGILVGVMDGLGHGDEATLAARIAMTTLEEYAHESVISLVNRCHSALLNTRGVVMSLASFNASDETMTWLGIGNVEGLLVRADPIAVPAYENVLLRGGVVGYQIAALRAHVIALTPGDTLILATDGVRSDFPPILRQSEPPQRLADRILDQCKTGIDDALVLVARYLGGKK